MSEEEDFLKRMSERWGVHVKTIKTWLARGVECGVACPVEDAAGSEFVVWYRDHFGRDPSVKVKRRAEELDSRDGVCEDPELVAFDRVPVEVIEKALTVLGLGLHVARAAEEVERAHAIYQSCLENKKPSDVARRNWQKAAEVHRAMQKGDDCVQAAELLLRVWVKREWEPAMRKLRAAVGGRGMGVKMRDRLRETTTEGEWARVWDRGLEEILRGVEEERE